MYTVEAFKKLFNDFVSREEQILNWKTGEYTDNVDKLMNFRQIADFLGVSMSDVVLIYLMKHMQSIALAVQSKNYVWDWEKEGGEGLKQRVADARNYLLLLSACLEEEKSEGKLTAIKWAFTTEEKQNTVSDKHGGIYYTVEKED